MDAGIQTWIERPCPRASALVSRTRAALSCGFSGAEVFSRTFRSHFGQSPREFRSNFSTDRLHRFHPEFVQRLG